MQSFCVTIIENLGTTELRISEIRGLTLMGRVTSLFDADVHRLVTCLQIVLTSYTQIVLTSYALLNIHGSITVLYSSVISIYLLLSIIYYDLLHVTRIIA